MKNPILSILLATLWISLSEFFRNQLVFGYLWVAHYQSLGLTFPAAPINGAMWGLWSLLFAVELYILAQKFSLVKTALLGWLSAFVMMWVTIGNLGVLPFALLWYAVPLSLLETFVAAWIIKKICAKK